jgi:hypothetical protein
MASVHRLGEIFWPGDCNNDDLIQVEFTHCTKCLIKKNTPAAAVFAVANSLQK